MLHQFTDIFKKVPHVRRGGGTPLHGWTSPALWPHQVNNRYNYLLFSSPQITSFTAINTCAATRTRSLTGVYAKRTLKVPLKSSRRRGAAGWTELHQLVQFSRHSNHIIPATLPLVLPPVFDTDTRTQRPTSHHTVARPGDKIHEKQPRTQERGDGDVME